MIDWRFFVALMLGCLMLATRPVAADSTPTSDFIDRGDGTVSHALTGLMWQRCAVGQTWNGLTCEGEAAGFTFAEAQAISSSLGGHVDWRLPSVWELMSIVDFDESTPAINGDLFPNTPPSLPFWSGSLDSAGLYSWFVFSGNGYAGVGNRSEDRAVRLVRGGETIDPYLQTTAEYIDHGDGTVTHQRTGLIWQRCLVGQQWSGSGCDGSPQFHTFEQALSAGSRVAGEHEWRLPSITELYSIVDQSRSEPAILPEIFPQDPGERIWSSSPNASAPTTAWAVDFGLGSTGSFNGGNGYGVRLVQGAQTSDHQTAPVDAASADTPRPLLNPQLYDLVDYFPLEGGAWREYQGIDSDGDRWLSRNETAIEQTRGMELTQERWLEPNGRGGWVLEDYTLLRYDDELLYVEGQYDTVADPPFDAGYLWFSPPLAIPRMVEPGRRYTATGGVTLPWGQRAELVMEFSFYPHPGRRVAAGTFRDCLEVHQSERFSLDDESDSGIWWWCRGVGEVETYDVDPDSGELTDREELLDWWVPGREAVADPVDGWQLAAALDSGRDSFAAAAIDGEIVVYGGNRSEGNNLASTAIYSPQRDRWQDGRNGPQQADQLSGAACDGAFYVTGGDNNGEFPLFLRYTPDRNRWETLDPPPYPLASEVLACAGDALIAVAFERGELLRWGLDDNTGWARLTTIPDRRDQAAVALANGRLYLFGGYASDGAILDSVLVYDLLAQRWLDGPRQPMPLPVAGNPHNSAVPVVDGQAVLVGGVIGDQSGGVSLHNQLQLYALEADRWQFGPALPLGITGHASVVLEDQLYVIGGVSAAGGEARLDSMLRLALNQLPTAPEPPPLQLTPQASVLKPGESLLLSATGGIGDYRWAASAGVLSAVTTATRNRIVTLNGGEKVRFLPPVEPGLHSVVVRSGGQMVAATVTVADLSQAVVDLQLSGVADPLRVEEERVVGVSGYLADGRLVDLARRAEWRSSDPDVATVTAGGRVVGVAGGGFTLTVEVAGQSRTVEWQVEEAEGVIEVDPYPLLIAVGRELQPAVQRVSADGSVHPFASGECALTLLEAGSDKSGEFELLPDGRLRGVEVGEGAVAMSCGGLELTVPV